MISWRDINLIAVEIGFQHKGASAPGKKVTMETITVSANNIERIFNMFERSLNKYNRSKEELKKYPDSEFSQVSMYLSYGKCNAISACILAMGGLELHNEFFKWCDAKKLDYYEVLNLEKPNDDNNNDIDSIMRDYFNINF